MHIEEFYFNYYTWIFKKIYLNSRVTQRNRKRWKRRPSILKFPFQMAKITRIGLVQSEALFRQSLRRTQEPNTRDTFCCFPRYISKDLDQSRTARTLTSAHMGFSTADGNFTNHDTQHQPCFFLKIIIYVYLSRTTEFYLNSHIIRDSTEILGVL